MKINDVITIEEEKIKEIFDTFSYYHDVVYDIENIIKKVQSLLNPDDYVIDGDKWISKKALISDTALINGPCLIMDNVNIRHCAYIRGSVLIFPNCVIGNSTEIKNSILFNNVKVPHFNYIGDSVIGNNVCFGAGAVTSNVKINNTNVIYETKNEKVDSCKRKLGALIGDNVFVGCNCVVCPGTIVDKNTVLYPLTMARGYIKSDMIVKNMDDMVDMSNEVIF